MAFALKKIQFPEIVIGLAGPVGTDMAGLGDTITDALQRLDYQCDRIKLTTVMSALPPTETPVKEAPYFDAIKSKIARANEIRKYYKNKAIMACLAVFEIRKVRAHRTGHSDTTKERNAYIIDQLKRPEEVAMLRAVYGLQFILISAYSPSRNREQFLRRVIRDSLPSSASDSTVVAHVLDLMEIDASEKGNEYGQDLRNTYPLADFFVETTDSSTRRNGCTRFLEAFFGRADVSPTKAEYGMYSAKSASLRSADLSRQVGAAIFSDAGELVTQGCNEVPKFGGGTYWESDDPDNRDVKKGFDPNDKLRQDIVRDLIERLHNAGWLSSLAKNFGSEISIATEAIRKGDVTNEPGPLADGKIMDLTEYGRIVHAEMCAICDAARLGKSVLGSTIFVTTFPCHNCTKHIIAVGIKRVIFIEPYPKSRARELHEDEIEIDSVTPSKVSFTSFTGISPIRYPTIFHKGKRKDAQGRALGWLAGHPEPMVEVYSDTYVDLEKVCIATFAVEETQV